MKEGENAPAAAWILPSLQPGEFPDTAMESALRYGGIYGILSAEHGIETILPASWDQWPWAPEERYPRPVLAAGGTGERIDAR